MRYAKRQRTEELQSLFHMLSMASLFTLCRKEYAFVFQANARHEYSAHKMLAKVNPKIKSILPFF